MFRFDICVIEFYSSSAIDYYHFRTVLNVYIQVRYWSVWVTFIYNVTIMNYDDQSSLVEIVFLSVRSTSLDIAFLPSLTCINLQIKTVYNCLNYIFTTSVIWSVNSWIIINYLLLCNGFFLTLSVLHEI